MGYPVEEKIEGLIADPEATYIERHDSFDFTDAQGVERLNNQCQPILQRMAAMGDDLRMLLNDGVCLGEKQWRKTFDAINEMSETASGRHSDVPMSEVVEVANLVNGFNLECRNCLNEKCKKRDPLVPVESVKARV